ncbi:MAG: InlB B-repeat-containing protein [Burkholderiales bacterium]|nr:InlB B-repeat-containing protein [Burkholderiales bacterium]
MSLVKHLMAVVAMVLCGYLAVMPVYAGNHIVATEAELNTALADTDPVINITVAADITITSTKVIPYNKTVNITSDGNGAEDGRWILLRGANMTGAGYSSTISQLFRVNNNKGTLNLSSIVLDGAGFAAIPVAANSELILNGGDVTLGSGATLRNNRNMSGDNAIGSDRSTGGGITVFPGTSTTANSDATLTILNGAEVTNNVAALGCGVVLYSGSNANPPAAYRAIVTMKGGRIHGNRAFYAAGVYVVQNAEFHLEGGEIYNNHADIPKSEFTYDYIGTSSNLGGGVFTTARFSDFYMSGGKIYNNTATASAAGLVARGGGIEASSFGRDFAITGGEIYGNTSSHYGGGISAYRAITISGDTQIYGNTAVRGGGIFQMFNGSTPSSATISDSVQIDGNTASGYGGGIYAYDGASISVNDQAQITNNAAGANGGGLWVSYPYLAYVDVGPAVVFANNSAQAAYLIADADKPTHATHVLTTRFTQPFDQPTINWGYNNYDIAYTAGALSFVVSFDSVGGSAVASELVMPNNAATRPADPIRAGHTFQGWYVDSSYSAAYDFSTLVNSDRTLYANWLPSTYTATSIPTTSGGVLAALGVLLAGLAAGTLRRRQR